MRGNPTLSRWDYNWAGRLLLEGGKAPVFFALLMAVLSYTIANVINLLYVVVRESFWAKAEVIEIWGKVNPVEFLGAAWAIQAALVALVFPLVLAFTAIMLQRRAQSILALRVYMYDSGAIPSGASSSALLFLMGVQYFFLPFLPEEEVTKNIAAQLFIANGFWLLANFILTAYFIVRTLAYINDDESRRSFLRIALSSALPTEIQDALSKHLVLSIRQRPHKQGNAQGNSSGYSIDMLGFINGVPQKIKLPAGRVVIDVRLNFLRVVAWNWFRRSKKSCNKASQCGISFPVYLGYEMDVSTTACSVQGGLPLNWFERLLVRYAYITVSYGRFSADLRTKEMLREVADEVSALAAQRRYSAACQALSILVDLHINLLEACITKSNGHHENIAVLSPDAYGWGQSSFEDTWADVYREVASISIQCLQDDQRLFDAVCLVGKRVMSKMPSRPESISINILRLGATIAYKLLNWRQENIEIDKGAGDAQINRVYDNALTTFVGHWGALPVGYFRKQDSGQEHSELWDDACARYKLFMAHIEWSAQQLIASVTKNEQVSAEWFFDMLMKWWGEHGFQLTIDGPDYALADQDVGGDFSWVNIRWPEVQEHLRHRNYDDKVEVAIYLLNSSINKYLDCIRQYLTIYFAEVFQGTKNEKIAWEVTVWLINAKDLKSGGGQDEMMPYTYDLYLANLLEILYSSKASVFRNRLTDFSEMIERTHREMPVPGRTYVSVKRSLALEDLKIGAAKVLIYLAPKLSQSVTECAASELLVYSLWKDFEILQRAQTYLRDVAKNTRLLTVKKLRANENSAEPEFESRRKISAQRISSFSSLGRLIRIAIKERQTTIASINVSEQAVKDTTAKIAAAVLNKDINEPFKLQVASRSAIGEYCPYSLSFETHRARMSGRDDFKLDETYIEELARHIIEAMASSALVEYINRNGVSKVNEKSFARSNSSDLNEVYEYLSRIIEICETMVLAGDEPMIFVGKASGINYFQPATWGNSEWQKPLKDGITIRGASTSSQIFGKSYINNFPVYPYNTPEGNCYVISRRYATTLSLKINNAGSYIDSAWEYCGDENVKIKLSWGARIE